MFLAMKIKKKTGVYWFTNAGYYLKQLGIVKNISSYEFQIKQNV